MPPDMRFVNPNAPPPVPGPAPAAFGGIGAATGGGDDEIAVSLGLGAAALVLLALIFIVRAARPTMIPAPTAYTTYTALDKSFTCDQPVGWSRGEAGGDGGNAAGVYFKSGAARIDVDGDLTGSLMGDMMRSSNRSSRKIASGRR